MASTHTVPAPGAPCNGPSNGANGGNGAPALAEGWRALPTLPAALFQFLGLVADRGTTDEQLAEMIWTDPALLARAITAVNASTAERNLPAGQIRQAIALLGRERLRQLAYTTPLLRSVEPMRTGFHPATFWERSLLCANVCESLAQQLGLTAPAQYYVAGLFHDIGYLKVLQEKPAALRTVIERWTARPGDLLEMESEAFGMDHCRQGLEFATQLRLPLWIHSAIGEHHRATGESERIVRITCIASAFCSYKGIDFLPARTLSPSAREREMKEIIRCLLPELPENSASEILALLTQTVTPVRNWISRMLAELNPRASRQGQQGVEKAVLRTVYTAMI
jgi:putative nucleotidyltransferase with HDIG domain